MFNFTRALDRNADRQPDVEAVICDDTRLTHGELYERVNALAAGLIDSGVGEGDVVALLLHNCPEFLEASLAINRVGAIFLPLNFRLAVPEWAYIVEHAGARAIVTEPVFAEAAVAIGQSDREWTIILVGGGADAPGAPYEELIAKHKGSTLPPADVGDDDVQRLMYTSGTTAHPKGVPVTYGNVLWKTFGHVVEFGITGADRTLMAGPMYHVGALDLPGTGTWYVGGSLVILRQFDPTRFLEVTQIERPTNVWLAPAMVNAIMQLPDLGSYNTASIRFIINGGEKMPVTLIERILAAFPNAWFSDAYGLTETVSGDTFVDRDHVVSKIGSVGKPVLHLDVKVVDHDDKEVGVDEKGEILLRGPKVVSSYWKNPAATEAAFTHDGWFHTGDIGHIDGERYLYIDDRKKDMIVSGGENIATPEVERVLYEHDSVFEAAVVGMPHPEWGEVPKAYVVLKPGADTTAEELVEHCREYLARFKVPKAIEFIPELPRSPSGKVLKRELR